jgi:hypothetical protein
MRKRLSPIVPIDEPVLRMTGISRVQARRVETPPRLLRARNPYPMRARDPRTQAQEISFPKFP